MTAASAIFLTVLVTVAMCCVAGISSYFAERNAVDRIRRSYRKHPMATHDFLTSHTEFLPDPLEDEG